MKLSAVQVQEFRCVHDSGKFLVADVTCLVGKNESGKTAILQALYRLNPVVPAEGGFDVTDDYPRATVQDYQQSVEEGQREEATPITATFTLDKSEIEAIEQAFGKGVLYKNEFTLSKSYNQGNRTLDLGANEVVAIKHLIRTTELSEKVVEYASKTMTLKAFLEILTEDANEKTKLVERETAAANAIEDSTEKAKAKTLAQSRGESAQAKSLRTLLEEIAKDKSFSLHLWSKYLVQNLPRFLYFDEYYQMTGEVNIDSLIKREEKETLLHSDKPMIGLIELARLDLKAILNTDRTETLISKLEGASNFLTSKILQYWSQNHHLRIAFDVRPGKAEDPQGMQEGTNLWGRVHDSLHSVSTRLGTRSKGFVWFFSFLAWFSKQRNLKQPLILLLDEPGLYLHAKAQGDLLRYIEEELRPHHQVIYTTHSPFMVDSKNFGRVRIVEDRTTTSDGKLNEKETGTKVFTEVLNASETSLFPLQGALGFDIAQTLFIGPNCLIVEGASDLLYIQVMSSILESNGKTGLDPNWTITPVGGADKVATFCALLGSQKGLNIATLIDRSSKDAQKIENLYTSKLLSKKQVLTYADFAEQEEADIEDMFELGIYLSLVNGEYAKALSKKITQAELKSKKPRMVQRFEEYFATSPLGQGQKYNHYRPARYLSEKSTSLEKAILKSTKTIDRFDAAFARLNALVR